MSHLPPQNDLAQVVERERLTVSSTFETDSESHAVGAVLFLLLLAVENQKRPLGQTWIGDDAKTHPRSPAREYSYNVCSRRSWLV